MRADMRGHDIAEQSSRVRRAGLGGRRSPSGPRPVRPGVVPVGVRPMQPARPATPAGVRRSVALTLLADSLGSTRLGAGLLAPVRRAEQRVLDRQAPVMGPLRVVVRRRHGALVVVALMMATAACVVLLGLLADTVSDARTAGPVVGPSVGAPAEIAAAEAGAAPAATADTVTVGAEATVWDVAQRLAPGASGPDVAALAERLVTDNGLSTVRVQPGQVLRVTGR
jgi:hypothetical protein